MKVFFDGVQINSDYIYELSKEHQLFTDSFRLGSVSARTYKLVMEKGVVSSIPSVITLLNDDDSYEAVLQVDNIEEDSDLTLKYSLIDHMVDLSFNYNASPLMETGSTTTMAILQDICEKANLTLANESFGGDDIEVDFYDNTITAREYVGYIATLNGGYAIINNEGKLELKKFTNIAVDTIAVEDCDSFKLGERHVIDRVVYDDMDGTYWAFGEGDGDTLYLNTDNVYIYEESTVEAIYNSINGFTYYSLTSDNCPIGNAVVGETIAFTLNGNTYNTIAQISQSYTGGDWFGGYSLQVESSKQEETKVNGIQETIKSIKTTIDRNRNEFTRQVSEVQTNMDVIKTDLQNQINENTTQIIQNSQEIILRALKETVDREFGSTNDRVDMLETHLIVSADGVRVVGNDASSYTYYKDKEIGMVVDGQTQFTQTQYGTNTHAINIDGWVGEVVNSGNTYIKHKKGS